MRKGLMLLILIVCGGYTYGQQLHSIRFVHIGAEDKPIGTLAISVEKIVNPKDRPGVDRIMGQSVKTDNQTFRKLVTFIERNKYLTAKTTNQPDFLIVINDASKMYLDAHYVHHFFTDLLSMMAKQDVDKVVVGKLTELKQRLY